MNYSKFLNPINSTIDSLSRTSNIAHVRELRQIYYYVTYELLDGKVFLPTLTGNYVFDGNSNKYYTSFDLYMYEISPDVTRVHLLSEVYRLIKVIGTFAKESEQSLIDHREHYDGRDIWNGFRGLRWIDDSWQHPVDSETDDYITLTKGDMEVVLVISLIQLLALLHHKYAVLEAQAKRYFASSAKRVCTLINDAVNRAMKYLEEVLYL